VDSSLHWQEDRQALCSETDYLMEPSREPASHLQGSPE
jgi:hypothetical protein